MLHTAAVMLQIVSETGILLLHVAGGLTILQCTSADRGHIALNATQVAGRLTVLYSIRVAKNLAALHSVQVADALVVADIIGN